MNDACRAPSFALVLWLEPLFKNLTYVLVLLLLNSGSGLWVPKTIREWQKRSFNGNSKCFCSPYSLIIVLFVKLRLFLFYNLLLDFQCSIFVFHLSILKLGTTRYIWSFLNCKWSVSLCCTLPLPATPVYKFSPVLLVISYTMALSLGTFATLVLLNFCGRLNLGIIVVGDNPVYLANKVFYTDKYSK